MDGVTIAFGIYLLVGVGLTLWTVIWALLRMTIRGCIYIGGVATAIGFGITQLGADAMWTAAAGTILLWPVVYLFGVLLPIGILLKLGPDARGGGGNQHIPASAPYAESGGGEVEPTETATPPRQICPKGCVRLVSGEIVAAAGCNIH